MKLREVFRYELAHRVRSRSTWVYAAILFGLAFLWNLDDAPFAAAVHTNAPAQVAFIAMMLSLFALPVTAAFFGDAAIRDIQAGMDPLLFTSPMRKVEYLGGRFLAALAANALVLLAVPLGLALPVLVAAAGGVAVGPFHIDPAAFGPFRAGAYAQAYLLFLLPNTVFAGAVLFTAGVLARKIIPVYLAAIGLFIGTMIVLGPDADDNLNPVLSLFGPLGFQAWNALTKYWTPAERNAQLIGFPAALVFNRVVWLTLAGIVLSLLHRAFEFSHPDGGGFGRKARRPIIETEPERIWPVAVPRVTGSFGFSTTARQTLDVARHSLAEVVASRWFVVVLLACTGLTLLWGHNVGTTVFDTSTWPVTMLVVETVLSQRVVPLIYLLIALYAGELVWKDREAGVAEIADAAPVPEGTALFGRFLALVVMIAMFQAACMVGGILIQAFQSYHTYELGLYIRVVFGLKLADYVLLAALAMTIHVVVNHKYLGHVIVVLAIAFTRVGSALGIRHHLLLYGTDAGWTYSDMNGFGPFIEPILWFKLYGAAWALLLAVVAVLFWIRGREPGVRARFRDARVRLTAVMRAASVAIVLILVVGGFIFYNTNILNAYRTTDELSAPYAAYEKRFGQFEDLAQPTLTGVELRVEIYPDEPAVDLRGSYTLVNRTGVAIDSVHVYLNPDIDARSMSVDRASKSVFVDEEIGYRIYALDRALDPGDSMKLAFDVAFRPRGFTNSRLQTDVVPNGAYFNRSWLPFIGYQPAFELPAEETRQRFGLEPRPPMPGPDDADAKKVRPGARNEDRVHLEAIIGTAADQIAITPGVLRRSWTENGRQYFHYAAEAPTSFGATVFSARYAVVEDKWKDVALRIFHHPTHRDNLERTVRSMKASLDYFTGQFGRYPDSQLRIAEIPRYGGFGHAHPNTIAFTEDNFLSRVREGEIDQPFYGTAHEIAHQWWPGQAQGAPVRGHRFLSESLANYSAMMVVERTFGPEVARRVYDFHMGLYLTGRANVSREVPVLEVTDQSYIAYRKGAVAMYTLREHIGEEAVNAALRRYLEKFRDAGPPYATSLDLYAELRAATPDSLQFLLTDLFETVTLWDVKTRRAIVEPTGTGEYRVTLDVVSKKVRADSIGNETEVPMDDLVEIGAFAPGEGGKLGEPLYLKRHRIRSGEQTIHITVPRAPARAGIDPYHKLIDRQGRDNMIEVETASDPDGA